MLKQPAQIPQSLLHFLQTSEVSQERIDFQLGVNILRALDIAISQEDKEIILLFPKDVCEGKV